MGWEAGVGRSARLAAPLTGAKLEGIAEIVNSQQRAAWQIVIEYSAIIDVCI